MKEPFFPPRLAECYRELEKIAVPETGVSLDATAVAAWEKRSPLLACAPPVIDPEVFVALAGQVFETLARYLPEMARDLEKLRLSLPDDNADRNSLIGALLSRDEKAVTFLKPGHGLPLDVFGFAFSHVLRILLAAYSRRLRSKVGFDLWDRGDCPVCGSKPNFSRIDPGGRRYLYCGLCSTQWRFVRAACPFCGTTDPDELSFYPFENGAYRVYVCARCKGYVKTIDERRTGENHADLFWEDIKTVSLDISALRLGFANRL
ncbi:MAG TPA: formate dehydrogenase accessory protein FdhE [Desulfotomaculum sp.]|nr:formate dehydrogenase accessory protein FdhE [Desulfotomaculum sp.]